MRGKILFVAGLAVGYVLGTKAGRERYDEISKAASKIWNDPRVQKQVNTVETLVKDKAPDVAEFVTGNAKKVVSQVTGKKSATRKSSATSTSTAAKTSSAN